MKPKALDPPPQKADPTSDNREIAAAYTTEAAKGAAKSKPTLASMEDYEQMLDDRPAKFTPEEVGFSRDGGKEEMPCSACFHWYFNPSTARGVCEIVRAEPDVIYPQDSCQFFTPDGDQHPKYDNEK